MGPNEGEACFYNWRWYYSVPGLMLWAFLAVAFVAVKENRDLKAFLVLIPLFALIMVWVSLKKLTGLRTGDIEMFDMMIFSLLAGVSGLWLLGPRIALPSRFITFILAMAIMVGACLIGAINYGMIDFTQDTIMTVILVSLLGLVIVSSLAMASRSCWKGFTRLRFILWQTLWIIITSLLCIALLFVIMMTIQSPPELNMLILMQLLIAGLVFGICIFVIVMPYMILALCCSFYRERLVTCLKLKSMAETGQKSNNSGFVSVANTNRQTPLDT